MKRVRLVAGFMAIWMMFTALPAEAVGEAVSDYISERQNEAAAEELNRAPVSSPAVEDLPIEITGTEEITGPNDPYSDILNNLPETRENVIFRDNEYYSELSNEDAEYLVEETGFPAGTYERLESAGYSLADSAIYGRLEKEYGMDLEELIKGYGEKYEVLYLSMDADILGQYVRGKGISEEISGEMMTLLVNGGNAYDIKSCGGIADFFQVTVREVLETAGNDENTFSEEETAVIAEISEKLDVDPEIMTGYMAAYGISVEDIEELYEEYSSSGNTRETGEREEGERSAGGENGSLERYMQPAYMYDISDSGQYDPSTGAFTHTEIDAVVPGVNGLDLVIGRIYNSYDDLNYVTPGKTLQPNSRKQRLYGLGSGWQFMFSSIENYYGIYLHTSTGATYAYDANSGNGIKGYSLDDMKFQVNGSTSNPTSFDVYYYKTGRHEHFSGVGLLEYIEDRYGNRITFSMTHTSNYNTHYADSNYTWTITDTLQRVTTIVKTNNDHITVTLPDNTTLQYDTYVPEDSPDFGIEGPAGANDTGTHDLHQHHYTLRSFTDQMGNTTTYRYQVKYCAYGFNASMPYSGQAYTLQYSLRSIHYPSTSTYTGQYAFPDANGAYKESILYWSESSPVRLREDGGFRERYFLRAKSARVNGVDLGLGNLYNFTVPDFTGYDYVTIQGNTNFDPNNIPSTYTYQTIAGKRLTNGSTTDTRDGTHNFTYYTMNNKHLVTNEITYYGNWRDTNGALCWTRNLLYPLTEISTEYNSDKLKTLETRKQYENSGAKVMETKERYEYDSRGNMTGYWSPPAEGNSSNTEYKTTNTYGYDTANKYIYLTSKQYKQDANTTVRYEYTYDSTAKAIKYADVLVNNVKKERTEYVYDSHGNVTKERRYTGSPWTEYNETEYGYSNNAYLTSTKVTGVKTSDNTNAAGTPGQAAGTIRTTMTYDGMGRLASSTDGNGNTTGYIYNDRGDVTKITNPDSTYIKFTRDYQNNTIKVRDENANTTMHYYNLYGDEIKVKAGGVVQVERTYTFLDQLREEKNGYYTTSQTYDEKGRTTNRTTVNTANSASTNEVENYTYSITGTGTNMRLKATRYMSNSSTSTEYRTLSYTDKYGRVLKSGTNVSGTDVMTTIAYDYVGNPISETSPSSVTTLYEYNYFGAVTKTTKADGTYATATYDALRNRTKIRDYEGNKQTFVYDKTGRYIKTYGLLDLGVSGVYYGEKYEYDAAGNRILSAVTNSGAGTSPTTWRSTTYTYNNRNRLTGTTGGGITSTYTYDGVGNMLTSTTGGKTTTYTYDRFGNVLTMKDALNHTETMVYNGVGRLTQKTDRNGNVTVYTLDALGRLYTAVMTPTTGSSITTNVRYAANGGELSRTEASGSTTKTLTYSYDTGGRNTKVNYNSGEATADYTHRNDGQVLTCVIKRSGSQIESTAYTYNSVGLIQTVKEDNTQRASYTYDGNGRVLTETLPTGDVTTYTYNALGQANTEVHSRTGTTPESISYTYYLDGSVKTKTGPSSTITYTYDSGGRLLSESETNGKTMTYAYDNCGNRSGLTVTGTESYTTNYTYDANNRLTQEVKTTGNTSETSNYAYDDNGNQTSKATTLSGNTTTETRTYNGLNQLVSVTKGGTTSTYVYRPDGLRAKKTVGGTTTHQLWDRGNIAAEVTGTTKTAYVRGRGLVYSRKGTTDSYYIRNKYGDIYKVLNSSGTVQRTYKYDAFGVEDGPSSSDTNPFRYRGEYFDKETGTYYLRARYYAPGIGRFTSSDPARHGTNWYVYCGSNPIMYIDPSGLRPGGLRGYDEVDAQIEFGLEIARAKGFILTTGTYNDSTDNRTMGEKNREFLVNIKEFNSAIGYIMGSEGAKHLLTDLNKYKKMLEKYCSDNQLQRMFGLLRGDYDFNERDNFITVVLLTAFNQQPNSKEFNRFDPLTKVVYWHPFAAVKDKSGITRSPAIILIHEVFHVSQFRLGIISAGGEIDKIAEEEATIFEYTVATQLGERPRGQYSDFEMYFKVKHSTYNHY